MIRTILFIAWLLPTAVPCHGEIYRWIDDQGKTHFSDKKPEAAHAAENISKQLRPLNSDSSASETEKLQQVFQGETAEEKAYHQQQQSRQRQQDNVRQRACLQAKINYRYCEVASPSTAQMAKKSSSPRTKEHVVPTSSSRKFVNTAHNAP